MRLTKRHLELIDEILVRECNALDGDLDNPASAIARAALESLAKDLNEAHEAVVRSISDLNQRSRQPLP